MTVHELLIALDLDPLEDDELALRLDDLFNTDGVQLEASIPTWNTEAEAWEI